MNPISKTPVIVKAICCSSILCSCLATLWRHLEVIYYGTTNPNRVDSIIFLCIFVGFFVVFHLGYACLQQTIQDTDYALMIEKDADYIFLLDNGEYVTVNGLSKAIDFLKHTETAKMLTPGFSRRILDREEALHLLFYISDMTLHHA